MSLTMFILKYIHLVILILIVVVILSSPTKSVFDGQSKNTQFNENNGKIGDRNGQCEITKVDG